MDTTLNNLLDSISENKSVANDLFSSEHYSQSLFIWHLVVEKTIKAYLIKTGKEVPYIHDIKRLVEHSGIDLGELSVSSTELDEITAFNLEARYDDYKFELYKKADKEYTTKWVKKCESLHSFYLNKITNG